MSLVRSSSQTPGALDWITLVDSRGISIWNYELSLDRGGGLIPNPGKMFWSALVDLAWGAYQSWVALAIWFLDWVVGLSWLPIAAAPFVTVGDAMQRIVTQVGVAPTFLAISALVAVLWIARGRWATGVWEVTVSLVVGAVAVGIFANPIHRIAGEDGWIAQTQRNGLELAGLLTGGEADDPAGLSKSMVDVFIRKPAELINFGEILDGGPCEQDYTTAVRGGPYGGESDIRDAVNDCDEALGEYAANPSIGMTTSALLMLPGAAILVLLLGSIAGSVLAAGMVLLWEGAKGAATLLAGVLPGAARGPLFAAVGTVLTRLALLFVTSIFLGLVTLLVGALLGSGAVTAQVFALVDVMLVVAWIVWRRQRRALSAASGRIAAAMAYRPGAGPARLPTTPPGAAVSGFVSKALQLSQLAATRRAATAAGNIDNRTLIVAGTGRGRVPPPPGRAPGSPLGPLLPPSAPGGGSPAPGRPPRGPSGPGGGRGRQVVGVAAGAGLLLASGGTGAVAKAAVLARRATTARRVSRALLRERLGVRPGPVDEPTGPVVAGRVIGARRG